MNDHVLVYRPTEHIIVYLLPTTYMLVTQQSVNVGCMVLLCDWKRHDRGGIGSRREEVQVLTRSFDLEVQA